MLRICACNVMLQVGVEHLLRDINDPSTSTLANQIKHKMAALSGLRERLEEVQVCYCV
jgi:26S proteasome regulatory subunit N8